jgi:hypothetical protein
LKLCRIDSVHGGQPKAFEEAELAYPKLELGDARLRNSEGLRCGRLGNASLLAGGG